MNYSNLINEIFTEPLNSKNFRLIKDTTQISKLIDYFEFEMNKEEKNLLLQFLIDNFNTNNSFLNACIFSKYNNKIQLNGNSLNEEIDLNKNITLNNNIQNFEDWIIKQYLLYFENNHELSEKLLNLLNVLLIVVGVDKKNLENVCQSLSKIYFYNDKKEKQFDKKILNGYLKLFEILYCSNKHIKPYNFFYFSNSGNIFIDNLSKDNSMKIKEGFTIFQNFNFLLTNENLLKLYHRQFEVIILSIQFNEEKINIISDINLTLWIQTSEQKKEICKIKGNSWVNLCIIGNTKKSKKIHFIGIVNNEQYDIGEISTFSSISNFSNILLYKNFTGYNTSFILINKQMPIDYILDFQNKYLFGIYKKKHVKNYLNENKNILNNILVFFTPEQYYKDIIDNITNNDNIKINFITLNSSQNKTCTSGVNINKLYYKSIFLIGGFQSLLPICECLIENNSKENFIIINKIIVNLLNNKRLCNMESCLNSKFFDIYRLFLEKYDNTVFTNEIYESLKSLTVSFFNQRDKVSLIQKFFYQIIFNLKILSKIAINIQLNIWDFVLNCFLCEETTKYLPLSKALLILKEYDKNHLIEYCCQEHSNFFLEIQGDYFKISNPEVKTKIQKLIKIIEIYLIKNENEKDFVLLLNFLSTSMSPCLYKSCLEIFINFLKDKKIKNEIKTKILNTLIRNKIMTILCYILSVIPYPDIIIIILKIFSLISIYREENNEIQKFFNSKNSHKSFINSIIDPQFIRVDFSDDILEEDGIIEEESISNIKMNESEFRFQTEYPHSKLLGSKIQKNQSINMFFLEDQNNIANRKNNRKLTLENSKVKINNPKNKKINLLTTSINKTILDPSYSFQKLRHSLLISKPNLLRHSSFKEFQNPIQSSLSPLEKEFMKEKLKYEKMIPILNLISNSNKLLYNELILTALIDWLILPKEENQNIIYNTFVIEIIVDLLTSKNCDILLIEKFIKAIHNIIIKDNIPIEDNCTKITNQIPFYQWFIETLFQCYLIINEQDNNEFIIYLQSQNNEKLKEISYSIFNLGRLLHSIIIFYSKFNSNSTLGILDELFLICSSLKIRYNNNKKFSTVINNFLRELLKDLLIYYFQNFSSKEKKFDNLILNEIISFCFEFIIYFNLEHKDNLINEIFTNGKVFSEILISGMNINISSSNKLKDLWCDYEIFNEIIEIYNSLWDYSTFQNMKEDKILSDYILNKKKVNMFIDEITILNKKNEKNNMSQMILISILFVLSIILSKNENDLIILLKQYEDFIVFLILASSNLSSGFDLYNEIQENVYYVILYALLFIFDEGNEKVNEKSKNLFFTTLRNWVILMLKITNFTYIQIDKKKKKGVFNKIISIGQKQKKKLNLSKCAVFKVFFNESFMKIFSQDYINQLSKKNFSTLKDSVKFEQLISRSLSNQNLREEVKDIFKIDYFDKIGKIRLENANKLTNLYEHNENSNDIFFIHYLKNKNEINMTIQSSLMLVDEEIRRFWEKNEVDLNKSKIRYKKIKKILFSFNGMWSNKEIFNNKNEGLLLYKIANHYGNSPFRPCLLPIYDINLYIPSFTSFDKNNLFLSKKSYQSIINLNINQLFPKNKKIIKEEEPKLLTDEKIVLDLLYHSIYPELYKQYLNFNTIFGENTFRIPQSSLIVNGYNCCYVKQSHHIKGYFNLYENYFIFYMNIYINNNKDSSIIQLKEKTEKNDDLQFDNERNTCYGSFLPDSICHENIPISKKINYSNINYIFLRRYYYLNSAIEIFTNKNKSYLFNFQNQTMRDNLVKEILLHFNNKYQEIKIQNKITGYDFSKRINIKNEDFLLSKIENWCNYKISNFDLLLWLNTLSNRTFNDISQYPIFPWIITEYTKTLDINNNFLEQNIQTTNNSMVSYNFSKINIKDVRDFSIPMGMMTLNEQGEKRKKFYIEHYNSMKEENPKSKPYFYGSLYSNPTYISHYLTRLFPFSYIAIELQGNNFDDQNRMFRSIPKTFECSSTQETDIRELIPEFYYLPEMFLNINNLNLGFDDKINDVILPPWSDNPYEFVFKLKQYLEFEEVSTNINKWIDLIFGFKQKGKEAENSKNLFIPSSYDDFNIEDINNNDDKTYYLRIAEFGLIPHQLFKNKEFPQRKNSDNHKQIKQISESCLNELRISLYKTKNNFERNNMIKLKVLDNEHVLGIFDNFQFTKYKIFQSVIGSKSQVDSNSNYYIQKDDILYYSSNKIKNIKIINKTYPIIIYNKGKNIAQGGFYDGKILVCQIGSLQSKNTSKKNNELNSFEIYNKYDNSAIISLIIDKEEKFIFCGTYNGSVLVYNTNWENLFNINENMNYPITSIHYNSNVNIYGSACIDGTINIYTFPTNKKLNSIKVESDGKYADFFFISSSPLPSFIFYCSKNLTFYSYSLTGKLIAKESHDYGDIFSPILFNDKYNCDYIIYGDEEGLVNIRKMPKLEVIFIEVSNNIIKCLDISEDKGYCYVWTEGQEIISLNDKSVIPETDQLLLWHMANDFS